MMWDIYIYIYNPQHICLQYIKLVLTPWAVCYFYNVYPGNHIMGEQHYAGVSKISNLKDESG